MTTETTVNIRYENPAPGVARIVMARPDILNAQNMQMTYELNAAFDRAARDDTVKVILFAADGKHFSAGHDLRGDQGKTWRDFPIVGTWANFDGPGAEGRFGRELEIYVEMCERWRNLPKPTIAEVQGSCIAGGLMLAWSCDIILASENARFKDPTVEFGLCGVEFPMHSWELGIRKAKEWLFTADWIGAEEARERGMVNRVVPNDSLAADALALAKQIALKPAFALRMTKATLNHVQDSQGRRNSMMYSYGLHQLGHMHNEAVYGAMMDPNGIPEAVRGKFLERMRIAKEKKAAEQAVSGTSESGE